MVQQSFEPGMTFSMVARQYGVAASQLFLWRKQYQGVSLDIENYCTIRASLHVNAGTYGF
jgi:transposase-like protein